jgi:regulator of sirC expression with transglutaminase-like and TPR domain
LIFARVGAFPDCQHVRALVSFRPVETGERLGEGLREALRSLLDDSTPAVRQAVLARLAEAGPAGLAFLQEIITGSHRVDAWHARWFLDELRFADPIAEFRGFIRSLNYELETGALLLSRTVSPSIDVGACCTQLDALAARCRELFVEPCSAREKCRVLNRVLFHEAGFHGNVEHYMDPMNSFLDQVLQRKTGIPISLSVLYLLVARRVDLELEPVGLPGHFLVGCYLDATPFFVDAFEGGVIRTPDEIFSTLRANHIVPKITDLAPTPVREVLCRTCRNLVHHYRAAGNVRHASLFAEFVEEFESTFERNAT